MFRRLLFVLLCFGPRFAAATPEALLVIVGDEHSAYDQAPRLVAAIDRLQAENPGVPLAILIDGDAFEYGNALARRSEGAIDLAVLQALVRRAPTVLNLGNHDPDLFGMTDLIARVRALGVTVISGNSRDRATNLPFAPASVQIKLGAHEATIVGFTTDALATFRFAVRPSLDLSDPVVWARQNLPALLGRAALPVVLSHSGIQADRQILPLVPDGTLFAGAHDHLRLVHRIRRTVYFQSGAWLDCFSIAKLENRNSRLDWEVDQPDLDPAARGDPALAEFSHQTAERFLTPEETAIVGRLAHALSPGEAARFAVEATRQAAGADLAVIGGTTFGAGLPAGSVSRYAFDCCVRFDGPLFGAEVDGATLQRILARANQGPSTPFAERTGENLLAVGPTEVERGRRYQFVTTDWIARNPAHYLGVNAPPLHELGGLRLKAAVLAALGH